MSESVKRRKAVAEISNMKSNENDFCGHGNSKDEEKEGNG